MDKQQVMAAVQSGNGLTAQQQAHIYDALDTHEQVLEARRQVAAFDWVGLLTKLIPAILGFIPGLGALAPLINLILSIFKIPIPPVPTPTPSPSDVIPPTPVP